MSDETSIQKPEAETIVDLKPNQEEDEVIQSSADEKKTPKRTPKRRSFIERAQRESEELVRNMGGVLELEGGRRTRSSTRGTPTRATEAVTPPPNKKARVSPATTKSGGRGRGARKLDIGTEETDQESAKSKPAEEKKVKVSQKKHKKNEKTETPQEVDKKIKDEKSGTAESKATESEEILESADQPDSVKEPTTDDDEQNNVDHDKESTKEPEIKEKPSEKLEKSGEPDKVESPPKSTAAPAVVETMEVDDEEPQQTGAEKPDAEKTSNTSAPAVTVTAEEKKDSEASQEKSPEKPKIETDPAKQSTPEPMEVDSSSKSSSEAANAISTAKEAVPPAVNANDAEAEPKVPSNTEVEVATEAKDDVPPLPAKEAKTGEVDSTSAETKATVKEAPASNDVSKETLVDSVVKEASTTPVKEPQEKCDTKAGHNDNGEPKIVNNTTEDGENHATPQACN